MKRRGSERSERTSDILESASDGPTLAALPPQYAGLVDVKNWPPAPPTLEDQIRALREEFEARSRFRFRFRVRSTRDACKTLWGAEDV